MLLSVEDKALLYTCLQIWASLRSCIWHCMLIIIIFYMFARGHATFCIEVCIRTARWTCPVVCLRHTFGPMASLRAQYLQPQFQMLGASSVRTVGRMKNILARPRCRVLGFHFPHDCLNSLVRRDGIKQLFPHPIIHACTMAVAG